MTTTGPVGPSVCAATAAGMTKRRPTSAPTAFRSISRPPRYPRLLTHAERGAGFTHVDPGLEIRRLLGNGLTGGGGPRPFWSPQPGGVVEPVFRWPNEGGAAWDLTTARAWLYELRRRGVLPEAGNFSHRLSRRL